MDFNQYASKGNEFLNSLAEDLGVPRDKAGRILKAVLHALRKHLSIEESLQVISQLPMALKGLYVDQWKEVRSFTRIHHVKEFLDEIRSYDKELAGFDLGNDESARRAVQAVFRTLNIYVSDGEFEDMISMMPAELKEFIRGSIGKARMV